MKKSLVKHGKTRHIQSHEKICFSINLKNWSYIFKAYSLPINPMQEKNFGRSLCISSGTFSRSFESAMKWVCQGHFRDLQVTMSPLFKSETFPLKKEIQ